MHFLDPNRMAYLRLNHVVELWLEVLEDRLLHWVCIICIVLGYAYSLVCNLGPITLAH